MTHPILIIGGGIGGLTAAVALERQGFAVQVFERAAEIGDVGAGISLGVSASKGLYALGLREIIRAAADLPQVGGALHYQTGEPLGGGFAEKVFHADDLPFVNQIHRADLFTILKDALEGLNPTALHLGHAFVGFEQDETGVTAIFADGKRVRGAALIGCDGIRSLVRQQMFGLEDPRFTGRVVYRFLVPMEDAAPYMHAGGSISYIAPRQSLLRYSIRRGAQVNCVAFIHSDNWKGEGWSERVPSDELVALFDGWHPDVQGLARAAPLEGTAKWGMYDREPLDIWTQGRVALLGDSAHPMLPFLGLGAAMAIEDAVVLARACQETPADIPLALSTYEASRTGRAGAILLESRHQGEIFSDGPGTARRPKIAPRERMNYDPATVPLGYNPAWTWQPIAQTA
jgi:salicylate hydroxylase